MLLLFILFALCDLKNCFFLLHFCFKVVTRKTSIYLYIFIYENNIDFPYYLASPIGIYLFKINNKNRKTMYKICSKLTRKTPNQMCKIKFLLMFSFSIILTSLQSFKLSFLLLLYLISTAILKFPP